jgi:predicted nucleic acid-binding protein
MIVMDTNVVSEILRPAPDAKATAWLEAQSRAALFTTTVTRAEVLYGIRLLPNGRRKQALLEAALAIFNEDLAGRVLSFDSDASDAYAEIGAARKIAGKPISQFDAMIAAITRSRGASLATRNVKDFGDCGISVVNPWGSD